MPKLLLVPEVADALRVTPGTVRRWARERRIDAVRIGRRVLISEAAVERLVNPPTPPAEPAR